MQARSAQRGFSPRARLAATTRAPGPRPLSGGGRGGRMARARRTHRPSPDDPAANGSMITLYPQIGRVQLGPAEPASPWSAQRASSALPRPPQDRPASGDGRGADRGRSALEDGPARRAPLERAGAVQHAGAANSSRPASRLDAKQPQGARAVAAVDPRDLPGEMDGEKREARKAEPGRARPDRTRGQEQRPPGRSRRRRRAAPARRRSGRRT